MKQYLAIDIGGTAVKLGIVDETGRVLLKGEESVSFDGYQTPVLTTVRRAAKEFLTTNAIPVESLAGIGVSATGQIDVRGIEVPDYEHYDEAPENATEVPESESSDLAWASGRIAAGMEWILLFPR